MQFYEITEEQILSVEKNAANQGYGYLVKNLKSIGVHHYIVKVRNNTITYVGQFGEEIVLTHPLPEREPTETFDLEAIKKAIQQSEEGVIDYAGFLDQIAHAGIHNYVADLDQMAVIYQGPNSEYEYVQTIQEV
jgi:uncharacterized protein YbcV (DUF1398 family)